MLPDEGSEPAASVLSRLADENAIVPEVWPLEVAVAALLKESPSLRRTLGTVLGDAYQRGAGLAASETGLPEETFPAECPFSADHALDPGFSPE